MIEVLHKTVDSAVPLTGDTRSSLDCGSNLPRIHSLKPETFREHGLARPGQFSMGNQIAIEFSTIVAPPVSIMQHLEK